MTDNKKPYEIAEDVTLISAPMAKWAGLGFLRGFASIRNELLPKGSSKLPSAAFQEKATAHLLDNNPDEHERSRRVAYINRVEQELREREEQAVHKHYIHSIWGQITDLIMACGLLALIIGLLCIKGAFHPLTLIFISLLIVKILFMHWTIRGIINVARSAFRAEKSDITLPWQ